MLSAHLLVLNYNARAILEETLPSLLEAVSRSSSACRLSVIDNDSTDDSVAFIKARFPSVGIFNRPNRLLCSYNEVAKSVNEEVLILLNNDLKVDPGFIDPLLGHFEDDECAFLVVPRMMNYEGDQETGGFCKAWMSFGVIKVAHVAAPVRKPGEAVLTFAAGSAGAYSREKFLKLGGYDDLYLPGTMEDVDLCFRAWKKGYRCLYEPRSVVYHKGQVSFHKRFGRYGTAEINARNVFLFMWKNFDDRILWVQHILLSPLRLLSHLMRGQFYWWTGFLKAFAKTDQVRERRKNREGDVRRSDQEVLAMRGISA